MSLALACARPDAPGAAPVVDRAGVVRLEASREGGTAELVARTRGPVGAETLRAIRALGRVGDPVAVARLVELLGADEFASREAAMRALDVAAALGSEVPDVEAALWQRWSGAATAEKVAIVESLRRIGGATAVPLLGRALAAEEAPEVREAAAIVLGILGRREVALDARARAGLVALAAEEAPRLQYAGVYGLAHEHAFGAGDSESEAALVFRSQTGDAETRAVAAKGYGRRTGIALPAALAVLHEAVDDPDPWVQVAGVRGLAQRGEEVAQAALWRWLTEALDKLDMAKGTGVIHPVLEGLSLLTSRPGPAPEGASAAHERAEERLGQAAPEAARAGARIACGLAALAARREDWRPPLACAEAVGAAAERERRLFETGLIGQGWGGPVEARIERLRSLAGDADPLVRAAAITAAGQAWEAAPEAVEGLVVAALADASPAVAGAAAEAVQGRYRGEATRPAPGDALVSALVRRAGEERDAELFAALAEALGLVKGTGGLPICEAALQRASASARAAGRACVKALRGEDPGPGAPSEAAPLPPHDPAEVLGTRVQWKLATERGAIDIDLEPEAAPWHVAAIVALTRARFYDGLTFHRVVPGYVVQGGDPHGTGWGGPGFSLPSEPSDGRFERGAVGIADAGKDTGGSQFFIMHARAPHLEGRYTRVGQVRAGLEIVDALIVGDRIVGAEVLVEK